MWKALLKLSTKDDDELVQQAKSEAIFQPSKELSGRNRHSNSFNDSMRQLAEKYAPEEMAEWKEQLRQRQEDDFDLFGEDDDDDFDLFGEEE